MIDVTYPLTIYYDSACPICVSEMSTLTTLDFERRLVLFDCAGGRIDDACLQAKLGASDLLAIIHARDANGRWLKGVDVFVAAYEAAGLAVLARLFDSRRLRPIWERVYPYIARNRYGLSRLGFHHLFKLIPHRLLLARATRATTNTTACVDGACGLVDSGSSARRRA
jgi:predicted DCC family thiol-disulfide oxidoreductase YuxK